MPSQENTRFCESDDNNVNQMFSYENDSRSQSHHSLRLKNESVEQQPPSVQSHKGFSRTHDNYSNVNDVDGGNSQRISTHELNSETVCAHIYTFLFIFVWMAYGVCECVHAKVWVYLCLVYRRKKNEKIHLTFLC